jgi:response regulator NasT
VVIAEDEAIIRLDLKEILLDEGYQVVGETGRGDDAVELVRTHGPDLVILDVKMPGADGLQAARDIRDLDLKVAVLILTAFSQRNLIDEARDAGVAAYLVKPFQRIELIPAIDQALARCEQEWAIDAEARQAVDDGIVASVAIAEDKLETRRLVDGAKGVLMERHGMNESDAFGFVQKTAMGTRSRMVDVARQILEGTLEP